MDQFLSDVMQHREMDTDTMRMIVELLMERQRAHDEVTRLQKVVDDLQAELKAKAK